MRLARFALLSLASFALPATGWLGCSSFSGADASGQDASSANDAATIAPGDGATGAMEDAATDAKNPIGQDGGASSLDTLPCAGGTPVLKDDMTGQGNWDFPVPVRCPASVAFAPTLGATFDCDDTSGAYQVLTTKLPIPDTRAVIAIQFNVLDETDGGTIPKHVFTQLLGALGAAADNLALVYDQGSMKSVFVYGEAGNKVAEWNSVGAVTSHILRIYLPPVGPAPASDPVSLTLDGIPATDVSLSQRNSGKLQVGPYLRADGHVKDCFGGVRIWTCP